MNAPDPSRAPPGAAPDAEPPFAALLERLAAEGGAPGARYEKLRRRLIQFFRLHLPAEAEALADAALDRLARRVQEGAAIENVPAYTLGIARLMLHEARARLARSLHAAELEAATKSLAQDEDGTEAWFAALQACLEQLGTPDRRLILDYYGADGAQRIRARARLARELGISLNALRNRALRLRGLLEDCVLRRLDAGLARDETPRGRTER